MYNNTYRLLGDKLTFVGALESLENVLISLATAAHSADTTNIWAYDFHTRKFNAMQEVPVVQAGDCNKWYLENYPNCLTVISKEVPNVTCLYL